MNYPNSSPIIWWLRILLISVLCVTAIGSLSIYSASSIYALETMGSAQYYISRHLIGILLAFAIFCITQLCTSYTIQKYSTLLYGGSSILLALPIIVPTLGSSAHGSTRWISYFSLSIQPIELCKVTLILVIARAAAAYVQHQQGTLWTASWFLGATGIIVGLLLLQPDLGQALLCSMVVFSLGILLVHSVTYILYGTIVGACITTAAILTKPYRLKRIMSFIHPWSDPQGAGFQIIQSLIALTNGGWWGLGIGNSQQKFFYLPMMHTDFIFATIGEEMGFIMCIIIMLLYIIILYSGCKITSMMEQPFHVFTTLGYTFMIGYQAMINIAVTTGIIPTKGIGLPFISYGRSALLGHALMLGIIRICVRSETQRSSLRYQSHV